MIRYLDVEEVLRLHFQVIQDYGGSHGVRDENALQAIVSAPRQKLFGKDQYETVFDKAAVYMRNIIASHPFIDGNKRTGVTACGIFLMRNKYILTAEPKELEDFAVTIATDKFEVADIAKWLKKRTKAIRK